MANYREASPGPVLVTAFGGCIFGLDPRSGAEVWSHQLHGNRNAVVALLVTPTAVLACSGGQLVCLDYPSGETRWSRGVAAWGRPTLLLDAGRLFVGSMGNVECFELDGQRLWHNPFKRRGLAEVALGFPGNTAQADDAT